MVRNEEEVKTMKGKKMQTEGRGGEKKDEKKRRDERRRVDVGVRRWK